MGDHRQTVVVVDDDIEMVLAIERLMVAAGFRALTFTSAEALLADAGAATADCFIFDVQLPGLSGFELCQEMARRGNVHPVIFITAYDEPGCRVLARAVGATAFFSKPFLAQPLLAAIAEAIPH